MLLSGTVFSQTLQMDTGVTVIAPNDFPFDGDYKVAYVLHGVSGNCLSWAHYSLLPIYAAHGKTVYVLPEVARSFYSDMCYGFKYSTYVTEELPGICRSLFRISSRREDTIVIGNSMGGFGALKCTLTKPERYGMCCAISAPCLFLKEAMHLYHNFGSREMFIEQFGEKLFEDFTCAFGPDFDIGPDSDIPGLAEKVAKLPEKPVLYCTCGNADPFVQDNRRFAETMQDGGLNFTYEEWEGEHNFDFFNQSLKRAIDKFEL